ncbi:MAG: aminotransferase class V-fold PLP-dependent enzyme [Deltaproteobacteria bacterium]|nr:aminotransferase class V-fold PLP-dependent enzyme [Deltaproteobacteria bacterium]
MNTESRNEHQTFGVDHDSIRDWFPALRSEQVFLDNAGGSQVPRTVIGGVQDYMINNFVQVDADYAASFRATQTVADARELVALLMNASGSGQVALGPSTSALCYLLADCYARDPSPNRDEIIICEAGHEANIGPWARLADRGYSVKMWRIDPETFKCEKSALRDLLSERTRILAVPHVSNLLGDIEDIRALSRLVHEFGARIVVDGVAYAPHRAMDVAEWEVDWYVYSLYKVYGPHMAALFGTDDAFAELEGPNHFFIDRDDVPYKFELGGVLHEGCAGIVGLSDYLKFLAGRRSDEEIDRGVVEWAFDVMAACEAPMQRRLIEYLLGVDQVRLIGPSETGSSRVSTVSFVHKSKTSKEIVLAANARGFGIRYGHFYAHRLASAVGLDPDDGVVRTSLVHYNSPEEIERLIEYFERIL